MIRFPRGPPLLVDLSYWENMPSSSGSEISSHLVAGLSTTPGSLWNKAARLSLFECKVPGWCLFATKSHQVLNNRIRMNVVCVEHNLGNLVVRGLPESMLWDLKGVVFKECDCMWQTKKTGLSLWSLMNWGGTPPGLLIRGAKPLPCIAQAFFLCGGWTSSSFQWGTATWGREKNIPIYIYIYI